MRKILSIIALFTMIVSNAFGATEYYALLVGIADYYEEPDWVPGADNDVDDIEKMLVQAAGWDPDNIWVRKNSSASKNTIQLDLSWFRDNLDSDDVFLFVYSGDADGTGDNKGLITYEWGRISPSELNTSLSDFETSKIVTIIDTPYSGLFESISVGEQIMSVDETTWYNDRVSPSPAVWCSHDVHGWLSESTIWGLAGYADPFGSSITAAEICTLITDPFYGPPTAIFDDNYGGDIILSEKIITTSGELSHSEIWSASALSGNVTVPSGLNLTIIEDVTIDLDAYYIKSTGGTIKRLDDVTFSPKDIAVKSGSTLLGQYSTIATAITNATSGQDVWLVPGTYTGSFGMKGGVDVRSTIGKPIINGDINFSNESFCTLEDFRVNGTIDLYDSYAVVIDGVTSLESSGNAVDLYECSGVDIIDFRSTYCPDIDIYAENSEMILDGLDIQGGNNNIAVRGYDQVEAELYDFYFCNNDYDIYKTYCDGWYIDDYNTFSGSLSEVTYGLYEWEKPTWYDICWMKKTIAGAGGQPAAVGNPDRGISEPTGEKDLFAQGMGLIRGINRSRIELIRADSSWSYQDFAAQYEVAITLLKQSVADFPDGNSTRSAVGRILSSYWRLGQPEEVFAYLTALLDDSKYQHLRPYLLSRLKFYYLQKGDYKTALELCDEILTIPAASEQEIVGALYSKGLIYLNYLGDAVRAADIFWQLVAEYPDNPTTQSALNQLADMDEYVPGDSPTEPEAVEDLALEGYPNPFNPTMTIRFGLPEASNVTLVVYDLMGREVVRLAEGYRDAGWQELVWDGRDARGREVPTGIYIARLVTSQGARAIKLVMMK